MKPKKPSRKDILSACSEIRPEDGLDPRIYFRARAERKPNRKVLQLCSAVAQAVGYTLAWDTGDELLSSLFVEAVVPAPDAGRLLVTVSVPGGAHPEQVLARLRGVTPKLRAAVAEAVQRRRVPELTFQVAWRGEVQP